MHLLLSSIHLFLVTDRITAQVIHSIIVEPRTITALPLKSAYHAELGRTPASHMVATLLKLHHGRTIVAFPPSSLFSNFDKLFHRRVFGTFSRLVRFGITHCTGLAAALGTFTNLATIFVKVHMFRLYPFATTLLGTVYLVLSPVFFQFPVPLLLEVLTEQGVYVLQIDFGLIAAFRWHMRGIFDGKSE